MTNGTMDEAGDVGRCHCPGTPVPDAAYCHWWPSSRAVQGRCCSAPVSVGAAGDTARARPAAPGTGVAEQLRWQWRPGRRQRQARAGSVPGEWLRVAVGEADGALGGSHAREEHAAELAGWEPLPAPGDNSDSSSRPPLPWPSTQGCGTARVCVPPSLAAGTGCG